MENQSLSGLHASYLSLRDWHARLGFSNQCQDYHRGLVGVKEWEGIDHERSLALYIEHHNLTTWEKDIAILAFYPYLFEESLFQLELRIILLEVRTRLLKPPDVVDQFLTGIVMAFRRNNTNRIQVHILVLQCVRHNIFLFHKATSDLALQCAGSQPCKSGVSCTAADSHEGEGLAAWLS